MTPVSTISRLLPPPRAVAVNWSGLAPLGFPSIALAAVMAAFAYFVISSHCIMVAIGKDGVVTNAIVVGRHMDSGKSTTYYWDLAYTAGGRSYTGDEEVNGDDYNDAIIGEARVPISYLRTDPSKYEIGTVNRARIAGHLIWTICECLLMAVFALALPSFLLYRVQSDLALVATGLAAEASVTDTSVVKGKSTFYYVTYSFEANGVTYSRKENIGVNLYNSLKPGDLLSLVYDPAAPTRNKLLSEIRLVSAQPASLKSEESADSLQDSAWYRSR